MRHPDKKRGSWEEREKRKAGSVECCQGFDTRVERYVAQGQDEGFSGLSSLNPREEVSCQMFLSH